jgi:hypothetical protein
MILFDFVLTAIGGVLFCCFECCTTKQHSSVVSPKDFEFVESGRILLCIFCSLGLFRGHRGEEREACSTAQTLEIQSTIQTSEVQYSAVQNCTAYCILTSSRCSSVTACRIIIFAFHRTTWTSSTESFFIK